jgi:hypothetical protein
VRNETTVNSAAGISLRDLERQLKEELPTVFAANGESILLSHNFVSLVRARTSVRDVGARRECRIEFQTQGEPGADAPVAIFGSRGLGWLDTLEVVMLNAGARSLTWKRQGKYAGITINGNSVGRMELGWLLQHTHIGTGRVWFDGEPFCDFALPFRPPSTPQKSDCTGTFTFLTDRAAIKFLINPKEADVSNEAMKSGAGPQSRATWRTHTTIFNPADEVRLAHISEDQRLLLLALTVWPWAIYKVPGTKAV